MRLPRSNGQRHLGDRAQGAGTEGQLDDRTLVAHGALAKTEEENREFFAEVAAQRDDDARVRGFVDRRAREGLHQRGVQAVAVLGVDVLGAQHAAQESFPRKCALVGQCRSADGAETVFIRCGTTQQFGGLRERFAPTDLDEGSVSSDHRFGDPRRRIQRVGGVLIAVDRLEREASLVAEPSVVHRLAVDAQDAREAITGGLHRDATPHGARRAGALDLFQVPGSRVETIRLGGQCTHRTDLDGITREDRVEGLRRRGRDLDEVATTGKGDLRVTRHVGGEPRAARALNAAFAVQQDQRTDFDGLDEVALLLDEARLAGAVCERLVLQRALAAFVTDRTVEWVIGEQEL